ncbi:MAG: SDR family NAD(P)-dependent oxidoreductase [Pseudonocardia sp.]|nr:SDR family NAD(P)-dependent oxidoreductase [Pseudonocardia sp.]
MTKLEHVRFRGGTAVVTGAASGMGEHLARGLAARGCGLALVDRDAERLASVAAAISRTHPTVPVASYVADLAEPADVDHLAVEVLAAHPRITLLINNAGVSMSGAFDQVSADEFDWTMQINFRAPAVLIRALLPPRRGTPGRPKVETASQWGVAVPPHNAAYATSKFALRGLSESLRHDLARHDVGVTTVFPGGVATRIVEEGRTAVAIPDEQIDQRRLAAQKLLTYPADRAAKRILRGVEKREARVVFTASAIVVDLATRLFPTRYPAVLETITGIRTRFFTGTGTRENADRPAAPSLDTAQR